MRKAFLFAFLVAAVSTTFMVAVVGAREDDSQARRAFDAPARASDGRLWSEQ